MRSGTQLSLVSLIGSILLFTVLLTQAQDSLPYPVAAVVDNHVTVYDTDGATVALDIPSSDVVSVGQPVWNADGSKIATLIFNGETSQHEIYVADLDGNVVQLETGALEVFPPAFTENGDVLFVEQGENRVLDPNVDYQVSLMRVQPESGAQPVEVGKFSLVLECDGGPSFPAEYQYWVDTGFLGNTMLLQETPFGILHSASCGGSGYGILNPETGSDTLIAGTLDWPVTAARGALSLDKTRLAAVQFQFDPPDHQRSLIIIDLATGMITDMEADHQPDQLTYGWDDQIYYTTRDLDNQAATPIPDQKGELPTYHSALYRNEREDGVPDTLLYNNYAFAIGRLAAAPDGTLLFNVVPNPIADAPVGIPASGDGSMRMQAEAVAPLSLYGVKPDSDQPPMFLGVGLRAFALQPQLLP